MFALPGNFVCVYHDRALIAFLGTILAEEIAKSFMIPEERAGTSELALYDSAWVLRRAEKFFEMHSSIRSFSPCSRASFETKTQNQCFLHNSRTPLPMFLPHWKVLFGTMSFLWEPRKTRFQKTSFTSWTSSFEKHRLKKVCRQFLRKWPAHQYRR